MVSISGGSMVSVSVGGSMADGGVDVQPSSSSSSQPLPWPAQSIRQARSGIDSPSC